MPRHIPDWLSPELNFYKISSDFSYVKTIWGISYAVRVLVISHDITWPMTKEKSMIQKSRKITGLTLLGYKNKTDDLRISSVPITHFFRARFLWHQPWPLAVNCGNHPTGPTVSRGWNSGWIFLKAVRGLVFSLTQVRPVQITSDVPWLGYIITFV